MKTIISININMWNKHQERYIIVINDTDRKHKKVKMTFKDLLRAISLDYGATACEIGTGMAGVGSIPLPYVGTAGYTNKCDWNITSKLFK